MCRLWYFNRRMHLTICLRSPRLRARPLHHKLLHSLFSLFFFFFGCQERSGLRYMLICHRQRLSLSLNAAFTFNRKIPEWIPIAYTQLLFSESAFLVRLHSHSLNFPNTNTIDLFLIRIRLMWSRLIALLRRCFDFYLFSSSSYGWESDT